MFEMETGIDQETKKRYLRSSGQLVATFETTSDGEEVFELFCSMLRQRQDNSSMWDENEARYLV